MVFSYKKGMDFRQKSHVTLPKSVPRLGGGGDQSTCATLQIGASTTERCLRSREALRNRERRGWRERLATMGWKFKANFAGT